MNSIEFFRTTRFFVAGFVVLSASMMIVSFQLTTIPTWVPVIGWAMFGATSYLDLLSVDKVIRYYENETSAEDDEED